VLHHLKYRRDLGLGEALALPLADFVSTLGWHVDMVVPVPLGQSRQRERGYNQADLIAWPLSLLLGAAYDPGMLYRARETQSQVTLSFEKRRQNVDGAFRTSRVVGNRKVMVLDDVATTGSTLSACAQALQESGVQHVYALTVARAVLRHGSRVA
jgi:ComF family protein